MEVGYLLLYVNSRYSVILISCVPHDYEITNRKVTKLAINSSSKLTNNYTALVRMNLAYGMQVSKELDHWCKPNGCHCFPKAENKQWQTRRSGIIDKQKGRTEKQPFSELALKAKGSKKESKFRLN
jgi:hypothetical protein